jgi:hypothetical protein
VGDAGVPTLTHVTNYKPWKYLYPRQWRVSFTSDLLGLGGGGTVFTNIGDPVGNHSINVNLLVPFAGDPSVAVSYSYNRLFPSFELDFRRTAQRTTIGCRWWIRSAAS